MIANKSESKPLNSSQVLSGIRDLIVHLHRGNATQAESIVSNVSQHLKDVLQSGADPGDAEMQRTQQTMFAIDEVRLLLSQGDFSAAGVSARDAEREWRQPAKVPRA
jgi:hypothetical protein